MAKRNKRERADARRTQVHVMEAQLALAHFRLVRLAAAAQRDAVRYFEAGLLVNDAPASGDQVVEWARGELESPEYLQALALYEPDEYMDAIKAIAESGELLDGAPIEEPPRGS